MLILANAIMLSALPVLRKGSRLGKHLPNCQFMVTFCVIAKALGGTSLCRSACLDLYCTLQDGQASVLSGGLAHLGDLEGI